MRNAGRGSRAPARGGAAEGAWPCRAVPRARIRRGGRLAPRARGAVGRGGAPDGHASTPAAGAGGGSVSVVRACVLLRWPQCSRAAPGKCARSWSRACEVRAPGFRVPGSGARRLLAASAALTLGARAGSRAGSLRVSADARAGSAASSLVLPGAAFPLELTSRGALRVVVSAAQSARRTPRPRAESWRQRARAPVSAPPSSAKPLFLSETQFPRLYNGPQEEGSY